MWLVYLSAVWTTLYLSLSHASYSPDTVLHKCCPHHERLTINRHHALECEGIDQDKHNISGITYEDQMETDNRTEIDYWWWFPKHLIRLEENSTIDEYYYFDTQNVSFDIKPKCEMISMELLFDVKWKRNEFRLVYDNNATLLEVLKAGTTAGNPLRIGSGEFCVDAGPDMYVALTCPCRGRRCVRKCCAVGEVYHVELGACQEAERDVTDWYPESTTGKGFYRLSNKIPDCSQSVTHYTTYMENTSTFRLLEDGSIEQTPDTEWQYPAGEFCVDLSAETGQEVVVACYHPELFGVIFVTVSLALLITSVLVLVISHFCFCKKLFKKRHIYERQTKFSVKI